MRERLTMLCRILVMLFIAVPITFSQTVYRYEPVPGKVLGILPDAWTVERLFELRTRYGFSGVILPAERWKYELVLAAGYPPSSIMIGMWEGIHEFAVDSLPARYYYIDEPVEHDCTGGTGGSYFYTPQELAERRDYVHTRRPGSEFVISSYKRCSHNILAGGSADLMMYASYQNWDEVRFLPVCFINAGWGSQFEYPWLPGNPDQRSSWTSMRNTYGVKYAMTWIHGGGDEYSVLFPHANSLGLTGLWSFNLAPIDPQRLESFCETAWLNGWLERVEEPLPVQLGSFTASVTPEGAVRLDWMTISELNNYGFEVQRRETSALPFLTLAGSFVPGHGTTLQPQYYSYTDRTATPGSWGYRLRQIDLDGSVHYGPEVLVDVLTGVVGETTPGQFSLMQNYPNPFNPLTTIPFSLDRRQSVILRVFDIMGREVETLLDGDLPEGTYHVPWDAGDRSGGIYVCRLEGESATQVIRLVLLK